MAEEKETKATKSKFSEEETKRAKEIMESHKVSSVFFNSKGEVFTQRCNAVNSEKGSKEKVREFISK